MYKGEAYVSRYVAEGSDRNRVCLVPRPKASDPNNSLLLPAMAKGKKSSLKSTLQSQQTRLNKKKKAEHAAEVAEQLRKKNPGQSKGKGKAPSLRVTIPFSPTDRILLIGEGNFSFARALIIDPPASLQHLPAANITATAYDSEDECYVKYPEAQGIVESLKEKGVEVLFDVDATKLEKEPTLKNRRWDRIVWNFPHAGQCCTVSRVRMCRLKVCMAQAKGLLTKIETF